MKYMKKKFLVLENGMVFEGKGFGYDGNATGELVFNTTAGGYTEILTDPSYYGQIVMQTFPLIGNFGLCEEDFFSEFGKRVFRESLSRCDDTGKFDIALLNEVLDTDEMGRITSMVVRRRQLTENGADLLRDMISRLKDETKRRKADGDELTQIADILANQRSKLKKN